MHTFSWLIAPINTATFFAEYWEKRPLLISRRDSTRYRDILRIEDVDHVLTTLNLRYPDIRVAKGAQLPDAQGFTLPDGRIDVLAVTKLFADGTTIILDQMQQRVSTLSRLCSDLEGELGVTFQSNLYLTPPASRGFKVHYDTHDVFILQVSGSKVWELFQSPFALPMPGQPHDETSIAHGGVVERFTLEEGDLAYIPRGVYHEAHSTNHLSLHVTLGAITRTWSEFLIEAVAEVSTRDATFRRALPIGFGLPSYDHSAANSEFRSLWTRLTEQLDFNAVGQAFAQSSCAGATRKWQASSLKLFSLICLSRKARSCCATA